MINSKSISFHISAPDANSVAIAGDFNEWSGTKRHLRRRKDGVWWTVLRLSPGTHQYKFLIDGMHWREDPSNPNQMPNDQGTYNSICEVA